MSFLFKSWLNYSTSDSDSSGFSIKISETEVPNSTLQPSIVLFIRAHTITFYDAALAMKNI